MNSDGLITTAFPAASAGIASLIDSRSGKFHGAITPTRGNGRQTTLSAFCLQQRAVGPDLLVGQVRN